MNKPKKGLLFVISIIGLCLISLGIAQMFIAGPQAQENTPDEPTPIQEGVMTARQKEHGKLFKGYGTGKKIRELIKERDEVSLVSGLPGRGGYPGQPQLTQESFVELATCDSDSVILGSIVGRASQLTTDGDFVFTDYTIQVETVLKADSNASVQPGDDIIVVRPGGKVKLNGHLVVAIDKSAPLLKKSSKYLLFLKRIPSTGGYLTLKGTSLVSPSDDRLRGVADEITSSFLDDSDAGLVEGTIRATSASACQSKTTGGL